VEEDEEEEDEDALTEEAWARRRALVNRSRRAACE
jgi:hypothetical protein